MKSNMGSKERKIRLAAGTAAAATAIFVPMKYKWKGLLAIGAFNGLFTGMTRYSPFKKVFHVGRA